MMKNLSIPLIFFISVFTSRGIADTIPNGGFEYWWYSGWTEDPAFWTVNNTEILPTTVVKDSDAFSGSIAMMMVYSGSLQPMASCGFPVTTHPYNIGGYVKNQLGIGDSVTFLVRLYSNNVVADSGYIVFYGGINPNYSPFEILLSQNNPIIDSCEISIAGGMSTMMSGITFDDLQFDFPLIIVCTFPRYFNLFPNPTMDRLFVSIKDLSDFPEYVEAYNMLGQHCNVELVLDNARPLDYIVELNISELSRGEWIIVMRNKESTKSALLIKH